MGRQSEAGNVSFSLRDVTVPVVDTKTCIDSYAKIGRKVTPRNMLCAGTADKSPCKGDSGGPLLTTGANKTLVGVISWGAGCFYAKVSGVPGWIIENVCNVSEHPPTWCPRRTLPASNIPTPTPTPAPPTPSPRPTIAKPTDIPIKTPAIRGSIKPTPPPKKATPSPTSKATATEPPTPCKTRAKETPAPTFKAAATTKETPPPTRRKNAPKKTPPPTRKASATPSPTPKAAATTKETPPPTRRKNASKKTPPPTKAQTEGPTAEGEEVVSLDERLTPDVVP